MKQPKETFKSFKQWFFNKRKPQENTLGDTKLSDKLSKDTSKVISKSSLQPKYLYVMKGLTYPLCVGKYDYNSRSIEYLSFKKGDLLYIIDREWTWWFARAKHSGQEGYIPSNYVEEYNFELDIKS